MALTNENMQGLYESFHQRMINLHNQTTNFKRELQEFADEVADFDFSKEHPENMFSIYSECKDWLKVLDDFIKSLEIN